MQVLANHASTIKSDAIRTSGGSFRCKIELIFQTLDEYGIRYSVLRDYHKLTEPEPEKEVDLLVDKKHLKALRELLGQLGFVETPSWGHAPHYFFVTYYPCLGLWLKLDLITELSFGKPVSALTIDHVDTALAHRVKQKIGYTLAREDEFLVLLLRGIINDEQVNKTRIDRILALYSELLTDHDKCSRLALYLDHHLGDALRWVTVRNLMAKGDWESLQSRKGEVVNTLFKRQPLRTLWRKSTISACKIAKPVLHICSNHGISVALLAPDGAGKSTLAHGLLGQTHLRTRLIYMGENPVSSNVGLPTTPWFRRHKKHPGKNPLVNTVVRFLSFPNTLLEQWHRVSTGIYHVLRGRLVVYDRYVYDTWINPPAEKFHKKLRRALIEHTCPAPDLVLLLDAPGTLLFDRKHEHSPASLEKKRQAYLQLQGRLPNLLVVDATRTAEDVQTEVIHLLWQFYATRDFNSLMHERKT